MALTARDTLTPSLRTQLAPGDIGQIVWLHGALDAEESGFDETFEAYVAEPLGCLVIERSEQERIWLRANNDSVLIVARRPSGDLIGNVNELEQLPQIAAPPGVPDDAMRTRSRRLSAAWPDGGRLCVHRDRSSA